MNAAAGIGIAVGASITVGAGLGVMTQRLNAGRVHEQWADYQDARAKLPEDQRDLVKRPMSSITPVWWTAAPLLGIGALGEVVGSMGGLPELTVFGVAAAGAGAAFIGANISRAVNHDPR